MNRPFGRARGGRPDRLPAVIEARDTGSSQADRQDGGQDFWPEDKPGRESGGKRPGGKLLIYGAAAVAVVIAAVVAGVVLMTGGDDDEAPAGKTGNGKQALPTAYTPDYDGDGMSKIARRAADQRPVTEGEAFTADAKTVKSGKFTFGLAGFAGLGRLQGGHLGPAAPGRPRPARLHADRARRLRQPGQEVRLPVLPDQHGERGRRPPGPARPGPRLRRRVRAAADRAGRAGCSAPGSVPPTPRRSGTTRWSPGCSGPAGAQPASLNEMIDASLAIEKPADFVWGRFS